MMTLVSQQQQSGFRNHDLRMHKFRCNHTLILHSWAKDSFSEMQIRDAKNLMKTVPDLDTDYINLNNA